MTEVREEGEIKSLFMMKFLSLKKHSDRPHLLRILEVKWNRKKETEGHKHFYMQITIIHA